MATIIVEETIKEQEAVVSPQKRNRIQVSTNKKPLYFYVSLAKRYMQHHNEIELSAVGMAIGTVVTVAEILKNNGLATEKKILTSTIGTKDEAKGGRLIRKAKIEILLGKTEKFQDLMTAAKADRNGNGNSAKGKANGNASQNSTQSANGGIKEAEEIRN